MSFRHACARRYPFAARSLRFSLLSSFLSPLTMCRENIDEFLVEYADMRTELKRSPLETRTAFDLADPTVCSCTAGDIKYVCAYFNRA